MPAFTEAASAAVKKVRGCCCALAVADIQSNPVISSNRNMYSIYGGSKKSTGLVSHIISAPHCFQGSFLYP